MQSWPIFMPGQSLIGRVATVDSSSVTWPEKPGSMKPAVAWGSQPSRPSDDLPPRRGGEPGRGLGRVDVRLAMVLEDSDQPVEPQVDARRLDHRRIERLEHHTALVE